MNHYCTGCNSECNASWVDSGVGWTFAWGAPHYDEHWAFVSDCCEEPVLEILSREELNRLLETEYLQLLEEVA